MLKAQQNQPQNMAKRILLGLKVDKKNQKIKFIKDKDNQNYLIIQIMKIKAANNILVY